MATTLGSRAAGILGTLSVEKLTRRKHVSAPRRSGHQLAKHLTAAQLIPIGIGSTIGAGVYVLIGTVARERAGPSLTLSFLIAGIAAALSAFCYAELASRCPSAGSAYHYAYTCVGEGVAWIIGWGLVLEYTVGGSAVARGVSPNLATFFGGGDKLPAIFMRREIPGTEVIADPLAGVIVIVVTLLLCVGIKESANFASVMVAGNICVLLFVVIAGAWAGFYNGWPGYEQVESYFPFGLNGTLGGAATLFFAFIGFDTVASTAEEVKHPQRDLPLGIGLALFICASLYMLVSTVIVGLVPYKLMDPDTPISSAFSDNGMPWAMFVVAAGAMAALCTTLMGSLLPQPRILMAMSRDGLLPPFLSNINKRTRVPVNGTILSGIVAFLMAVFMDVDELSGMVSVGTLLAFTIVGVAILILRYVPPIDDVPTRSGVPAPVIPASPSAAILSPRSVGNKSDAISAFPFFGTTRYFSPVMSFFSEASMHSLPGKDTGDISSSSSDISVEDAIASDVDIDDHTSPKETQQKSLLLIPEKATSDTSKEKRRRLAASIAIAAVSAGVICISLATSADKLANWLRWTLGSVGLPVFVAGTIVLFLIDQDEERHSFGQTGGFICPFVPGLPIASILINVYLLVNLGVSTWVRVSIWLVIGVFIYVFYGVEHSVLGAGGGGIAQESTESPALLDTDVLV